jgi:hypothetical protein
MIRIRSRHSRRRVPIDRSMNAFARGARTAVRIVRMPPERNTSSNPAVNLLSRPWIKNRIGSARSTNVSMILRACRVAHSPVGFAVIPASASSQHRRPGPDDSQSGRADGHRDSLLSTIRRVSSVSAITSSIVPERAPSSIVSPG